jgi:histone H3/H4
MVRAQQNPKASTNDEKSKEETGQTLKKKKKHRWRPGTVALRKIREFQAKPRPLLAHLTFERWVRSVAHDELGKVRFKSGVIRGLQQFAEDRAIALARSSNLLVLHTGRQTIRDVDITTTRLIQSST